MNNDIKAVKSLLRKIHNSPLPEAADLAALLSVEDTEGLKAIYDFADEVRRQHTGDGIFLRGIIEFSSYCDNACHYCGLNKRNIKLARYRMTKEEVLDGIAHIYSLGVRTVVLQSGEESGLKAEWLASLISEIKTGFDMAVTLSVGEKPREDYRLWKEAGADRYLLKIETSDRGLYRELHPGMSFENRLRCLEDLKELGYQAGSGIIVGLKGQTCDTLAGDIIFLREHDFDMIGVGPFIPHACTPMGDEAPGNAAMTLKTLALTRIVTKNVNLPATTALGSLGGVDHRLDGLRAGANVLMPNFTPAPYRKLYEIYPGKRCLDESVGACGQCAASMAAAVGRKIDYSKGERSRETAVI
jgi:biotin synthase